MSRLASVTLACAVWACGDNRIVPDAETTEPRPGTRLDLLWYTYPDGTREPERVQFYDRARRERCTAAPWSDGRRYCTPYAEGGTAFADAACAREVGIVALGTAAPRYVRRTFNLNGIAMTSRLFRAGAKLPSPTELYQREGDACVPTAAGVEVYELVDEIAREQLVDIHEREAPGESRLGVVMLASDDGMRMPSAVFDRELALPCALDVPGPGATVCRPASVTATLFHDAACTVPEVAASVETPPEAIVSVTDDEDCTTFHRLGTHVGPVPLYRRDGASCVEATASGEYLFLVGDPVEPATVEARASMIPGRRLQPLVAHDRDTTFLTTVLLDTATGAPCTRSDVFGTLRCMPRLAPARDAFADSACQAPVRVAEVSTRRCAPEVAFATMRTSTVEIYELGAFVDAAFVRSAAGCVPYETPAGYALRVAGQVLGVEHFPSALLVGP